MSSKGIFEIWDFLISNAQCYFPMQNGLQYRQSSVHYIQLINNCTYLPGRFNLPRVNSISGVAIVWNNINDAAYSVITFKCSTPQDFSSFRINQHHSAPYRTYQYDDISGLFGKSSLFRKLYWIEVTLLHVEQVVWTVLSDYDDNNCAQSAPWWLN